jgi:hypothetical protein
VAAVCSMYCAWLGVCWILCTSTPTNAVVAVGVDALMAFVSRSHGQNQVSRPRWTSMPEGNPAPGEVVRTELHSHIIAHCNLDLVLSDFARQVRDDGDAINELHPELAI